MKKLIMVVILSLVVLGSVAACGSAAAIDDTSWELVSYGEAGSLQSVIADTRVSLEFNSAENGISGKAGCNNYFGSYEASGSSLTIPGPVAVTEMYCMDPAGVMEQEQRYLSLLQMAQSYEINGDELTIDCGDEVLVFQRD